MHARTIASVCVVSAIFVGGCGLSKPTVYPGTAMTPDLREEGIIMLGGIEGCRGAFCPSKDGEGGQELPLALASPPPASSYHTVLRKRAAARYHVPEDEVRLGAVAVGYYKELDGTIIGWKATAEAGRTVKP